MSVSELPKEPVISKQEMKLLRRKKNKGTPLENYTVPGWPPEVSRDTSRYIDHDVLDARVLPRKRAREGREFIFVSLINL